MHCCISALVCLLLCRLVWAACCWYARHLCPFHIVLLIDDQDSTKDWLCIPLPEVCVCVVVVCVCGGCVCVCVVVVCVWCVCVVVVCVWCVCVCFSLPRP